MIINLIYYKNLKGWIMEQQSINYQAIVNIFNNEYEKYFGSMKTEYLDFEIWYLIYLRAKQSNLVDIDSLREMANILYNSYVIFQNEYEEVEYNQKIEVLKNDIEVKIKRY